MHTFVKLFQELCLFVFTLLTIKLGGDIIDAHKTLQEGLQ